MSASAQKSLADVCDGAQQCSLQSLSSRDVSTCPRVTGFPKIPEWLCSASYGSGTYPRVPLHSAMSSSSHTVLSVYKTPLSLQVTLD